MPPLGPRVQTKDTRRQIARAFARRQQNLRRIPPPQVSRAPNAPARRRPESGGRLRQPSDVRQALGVGENVYRRYAHGNRNILTRSDEPNSLFQNRPFPYGSLGQVERVNYESLANDVLKHLTAQFGRGRAPRAHLLPLRGIAGSALLGHPDVVLNAADSSRLFGPDKGQRDFTLSVPLHEFAHTRQRQSLEPNTRVIEGGAEAFKLGVAPGFYRQLGLDVSPDVAAGYRPFVRSVDRRGGLRYVLRRQFR